MPTISVETDTASHHPIKLTQPHPLAASAQSSLLTFPPTLAPRTITGWLVAVEQVAAHARRRTEERSIRHGDQIAINTARDPHGPAYRYDIAGGMSGDPDRPVEHDNIAGGLPRRNHRTTRDHHMIGRRRRATGSNQEG